jgi:hypothetical protein
LCVISSLLVKLGLGGSNKFDVDSIGVQDEILMKENRDGFFFMKFFEGGREGLASNGPPVETGGCKSTNPASAGSTCLLREQVMALT